MERQGVLGAGIGVQFVRGQRGNLDGTVAQAACSAISVMASQERLASLVQRVRHGRLGLQPLEWPML
jgi:hypothetical protein